MQTHNRYMNIIAIVIAAVCLSLATACGGGATKDDISACGDNTEEVEETNMTTRIANTPEHVHEVRLKYDDLFWRQPNVFAVSEGLLMDEKDELAQTVGIIIRVTEKVQQGSLPVEDRLPNCLEGVPVQIREALLPTVL